MFVGQSMSWTIKCGTVNMTDQEFRRFSSLIYQVCGIRMPPSKKTMLESRLQKRLRVLNMSSFRQYADLLFSEEGLEKELAEMVNVVTTNKTEFFREPAHYNFLVQSALPGILEAGGGGAGKVINIWSAGCSTGEEPYTLAMILAEHTAHAPGMNFSILATDISTTVLDKARLGIYFEEHIAAVPPQYRRKYFLKSKDKSKALVRVVPELRSLVTFSYLNFMDAEFCVSKRHDIIFCRNVIIYFDKQTQKHVLGNIYNHLVPGGYLFLGHSETLSGMDIPLVQVASTIYRKPL
jgi:chemotaxis protein methyltransferase CheR